MPQPVDIPQFAFPVENLLRPFTAETERFGERAEELNNLGDMIVVFAVFSTGLRVK